jgi:hypothetical protein
MLGREPANRGCGENRASLPISPNPPSSATTLIHPTLDPSRPRASTPPSHQATGIPEDLYHRAYTFCTRLLTLPAPYSTVALDCAIRLKTETAVPGESYWASRLPVLQCNTTQYQAVLPGMPKMLSPLSSFQEGRRIRVKDPEAGSLKWFVCRYAVPEDCHR